MLARYFMFAQVYYHSARLAYNEHLKDFLTAWLPSGKFSTDIDAQRQRGTGGDSRRRGGPGEGRSRRRQADRST
jgi:HD superfamily phosphohydrolase